MIPYRPLDKAKEEIRVLVLLPDDEGDEEGIPRLRCRLEHTPLSKASFAALSYVWGPQEENRGPLKVHYPLSDAELEADVESNARAAESRAVLPWNAVDDETETHHTTIGSNLSWALIYVRKPDEEVRLWIDAVCINQEDAVEKSWQVGLMAHIYARATTTLIWLGPNHREGHDDLDGAVKALLAAKAIGSHPVATDCLARYGWRKMGLWLANGRNWLPHLHGNLDDDVAHVMAFGHAVYRGMVKRLSRNGPGSPSVGLQEYALANSVTWILAKLQVGGDMLYIMVMLAWGFWDSCQLDDRPVNMMRLDLPQWLPPLNSRMGMYLMQRTFSGSLELHQLMTQLYLANSGDQAEATDPRDKVFALLGLVKNTMGIKPNYQWSVAHVYTLAASRFVLSGNAAFLSIPRPRSAQLKLPSWVVDWSAVPRYPARWLGPSASGDTKPDAEYPLLWKLPKADLKIQAEPECPVLDAWIATSVEDFGERILARRVSLRGFSLDSVALLGLAAEDHFDPQREDPDAAPELERINREVAAVWALDPGIMDKSDLGLAHFARYFHSLQSWLSNILAFADDENDGWSKALDIVLFGGNTSMNEDGRHSLLRGRIKSIGDLLDPRNWLLDNFQRSTLVSDVHQLADGCRIIQSAEGRVGYAPAGALPGDAILVLFGVPTPLVVRPADDECFTIIGPAYIYGVMKGEALQKENRSEIFVFE
ncbi:hypothetical protein NEMBOFW57_004476 [Staphylotrichum longicolle]|uniref:Heterokaryon incompatibility domain-containing protein n=1 Tax=Staphylotrichum longicolle TaxID=669026 RepID=A0AAD4I5N2_9PEZI|nr:hypothetical protein NEMBOFW57_004476 [Staphylotrichum longicolle]